MSNQYRALFQLSFVQFRPYGTSFQGLLLSLTLMPKSKKTLSFKTTVVARVEGLASNVNYLENRRRNFIHKKHDRKRRLPRANVSFSGL